MQNKIYPQRFYDPMLDWFFRIAASDAIPAKWFLKHVPSEQQRTKKTGHLSLEVVSHCWGYSHMLAYQLSSLVNHPPTKLTVTMTVFYNGEDSGTQELLNFFSQHEVSNVIWNWQELPKQQLFRRGIGRNKAALATTSDWVWFSDCDIMFKENCLDGLADALQGKNDILVFPKQEKTTSMLAEDDPMLQRGRKPQIIDIKEEGFEYYSRHKATGEFQITHGDVARACGYCANLSIYQTPSEHWCKCREDRAFRWLIGSHGIPIDIPNVYQIRHVTKGRYKKGTLWSKLRSKIRHIFGSH